MNPRLPPYAMLLGLAGLVPFLACGFITARGGDWAGQALSALLAYAAVILAFLGGVHWGLVLGDPAAEQVRRRLVFGVAPSLVGWAAVLAGNLLWRDLALVLLIGGFIAMIAAETRLARDDLMPIGYLWLRRLLSAVVVAVLTTVLVLRLTGLTIS